MRDGGPLAQSGARALSRLGRIAMLDEVADCLMRGKLPGREAAIWLASALRAYLSDPTSRATVDKYLNVRAPRGSHRTPHALMSHEDVISEKRED